MNKPSAAVIESVAPARDIDGLPISDGTSVRNIAHASLDLLKTLRLPRGGSHDAALIAMTRHYDGANGGEAGFYAMLWAEFRAEGSRWRTAGVKIRAEEASRIARDMLKGKPSKPGKSEAPRVGGKTIATDESELRGAPIDGGKLGSWGYAIFVRHRMRSGDWGRTRGVEVLEPEMQFVANLLKQLKEVQ